MRPRRLPLASGERIFVLLLALAVLSVPLSAAAQPPGRIPRIGILRNAPSKLWEAFEQRLLELGYTPNRNIALEYRWAEAKPERYRELAADLVGRKVDVIVAVNVNGTRAAKQATTTIPIVMVSVSDPVAVGLVSSLARPGGNLTGVTNFHLELAGKRLELLREVVPKASRVAVLWHVSGPIGDLGFKETQGAARTLGVVVQSEQVREPTDLERAFEAIGKGHAAALIVLPSPLVYIHRVRIAELAAKTRVAAMYGFRENVEAGGLMSYAANLQDIWRRGADYVDKILKGAKPADLPVEQPTKFEFVINLKTAQALGLTMPPTLLFQADEVIQ